jgi:hypothetical protein
MPSHLKCEPVHIFSWHHNNLKCRAVCQNPGNKYYDALQLHLVAALRINKYVYAKLQAGE